MKQYKSVCNDIWKNKTKKQQLLNKTDFGVSAGLVYYKIYFEKCL